MIDVAYVRKIIKVMERIDTCYEEPNLDLESYQGSRSYIYLFTKCLLWVRIFYVVGTDQKAKQIMGCKYGLMLLQAFSLRWEVRGRGS